MWFINAGGERGPVELSVADSIRRATCDDGFEPGFDTVWPAPSIGDMQGGMRRVRQPLGALEPLHRDRWRADLPGPTGYPQDMHGDLFFAEPVGRLIRRAKIVKTEGLTQLRNVYPGSEFVLGTDPLFRPGQREAGAGRRDLHRRHVPRHHPGSAVDAARARICARRSSSTSWTRSPSTAASGGCASTARLPVRPSAKVRRSPPRQPSRSIRRNRGCSTRPRAQLVRTSRTSERLVARHSPAVAGLEAGQVGRARASEARHHCRPASRHGSTRSGRSKDCARSTRRSCGTSMRDANPRMRVQAIRASETLYKAGDQSFAADYRALAKDADVDVVIQAMLTMNVLKVRTERRRFKWRWRATAREACRRSASS